MKFFFKIIFIYIFLFPIISSKSQTLSDTITNISETKILTIDTADIPSHNLYQSWNNSHVRVGRSNRNTFTDTIYLDLFVKGKFVFPFRGKMISAFGYRSNKIHTGTDIKLNHGDSVFCSFDGVVRMAKTYSSYGKIVVVRHYNGLETVYAHLSKIMVDVNQKVIAGDILGLGGRTGRASTDHLHFEFRYLGEPLNPEHIINFNDYSCNYKNLIITENTFKIRSKPIINIGELADKYYDDDPKLDSLENNFVINNSNKKDTNHSKPNNETVLKSKQGSFAKFVKSLFNNELYEEEIIFIENEQNQNYFEYTIVKGDTLYSLAKKYKIDLDELRKFNNLDKDSKISIGQKIKIQKN